MLRHALGSCAGTTLIPMPDTDPLVRSSVRLYYHPEAERLAIYWADRFVLEPAKATSGADSEFSLWAIGDHLELRRPGEKQGLWMRAADLDRRARGGPELLRACGLSGQVGEFVGVRVLDAMAGWGLDGLLLARMGCSLVMVEKHPIVHALLEDFARRVDLPAVHAYCGDGFAWLDGSQTFDVIYLDPMFPERRKRALPGKRMQYLAALAKEDPRSINRWLEAGLGNASGRVVLKRRLRDPEVAVPDWQITGRTVRYDVYRGQARAQARQ